MITPDKIDEWIKEAENNPSSAPLIIRYIANRLRELSIRNEELLNENIDLQIGKRVEEYEKRIAHLEYQLDLLRRHFDGEVQSPESLIAQQVTLKHSSNSTLIYSSTGQIWRIEANFDELESGAVLGLLRGNLDPAATPFRLLVVSHSEELMFVFSSGRVTILPVANIPPAMPTLGEQCDLNELPIPDEPRGSEILVCLAPVSKMALAEYFIQVSRKGYVKKINAGMAESILANHYIGTGIKLPADQTFEVTLSNSDDRMILVSHQGYLLPLQTKQAPFAIEEVLRLGTSDHLVGAFIDRPGNTILIATQVGKLVHRTPDSFEAVSSLKTHGQAVFSKARREQGVRVVGAASVGENDWGIALHRDGRITAHRVQELFDSGTIPTRSELLDFGSFTGARLKT
jgi:DNA gyrase/topoisomerase IV subunit A